MYARGDSIQSLHLDETNYNSPFQPIEGLELAVALDFDYRSSTIYFTDVTADKIMKASAVGSGTPTDVISEGRLCVSCLLFPRLGLRSGYTIAQRLEQHHFGNKTKPCITELCLRSRKCTILSWCMRFVSKWYLQLDWWCVTSRVLHLCQVMVTHWLLSDFCALSEIYFFE